MYRLYSPHSGERFYTASAEECDQVAAAGWSYEGVGWVVPVSEGELVWRQYNSYATTGAHNFTKSEDDYLGLCAIGWRGEGIAWYGIL